MHVSVLDEATLKQQLETERRILVELERQLNQEVTRLNPRNFGPTRADWDQQQELRYRQQQIKIHNLGQELKKLGKDA